MVVELGKEIETWHAAATEICPAGLPLNRKSNAQLGDGNVRAYHIPQGRKTKPSVLDEDL